MTFQMSNNCTMSFIQVNFVDQKCVQGQYWGETLIKISTQFFVLKNPIFLVNEIDASRARKLEKLDRLKKRPEKRPDWNELMKEIDSFRPGSSSQKLNKVACNDRSKPMLTKTKIQGKVHILIE